MQKTVGQGPIDATFKWLDTRGNLDGEQRGNAALSGRKSTNCRSLDALLALQVALSGASGGSTEHRNKHDHKAFPDSVRRIMADTCAPLS